MLRGGSWNHDRSGMRMAFRLENSPGFSVDNFGFRCAGQLPAALGSTYRLGYTPEAYPDHHHPTIIPVQARVHPQGGMQMVYVFGDS